MFSKEWPILKVSGCRENIEILCAKLEEFSLGILENKDITNIYIKPDMKDEVNLISEDSCNENLSYKWEMMENKDWHLMWQKYFKSIVIKNQIQILPDWDKKKYSNKVKTIFIRPGMSFGTGHHETTYLMLELLLDYKDMNFSLLDLGSGSGILSIAGQKLGFSNITSVEYDEVCKDDFLYNLEINNCANINANWMDATLWNNFNYNIVVANIEKNTLKRILKNVNKSKAVFVLSGLLIEDKSEMKNYLDENNFIINSINQKNEWIAITCIKQ